ncbi:Astacin-like metalloendopeptidase [Strongyloides ratti]|uniref:Metalloendopeptidase n=1 Tax=Strongyloides ratti TaxID=34506 RepID=A0A090LL47_STRRB|nr:Astacin-like metalloendopeptidase [Strongyloides ratti]CEF70440.2 Astacin-like metalloendopeptidase [Strongyloides ratti]
MQHLDFVIKQKFKILLLCNLYIMSNVLSIKNFENTSNQNSKIFKKESGDYYSLYQSDSNFNRFKRVINFKNEIELWPKSIDIAINNDISHKSIIIAISHIMTETCIKFNLKKKELIHRSGIFFTLSENYKSELGKKVNETLQIIKIQKGKIRIAHILREILYTLGLDFEFRRPDRNKYIHLIKKNINFFKLNDFTINSKYATGIRFPPHDFGSIMYHNIYYGSENFLKTTIIPLNKLFTYTIGQTLAPSFLDFKKLNYLYCSQNCKFVKIVCLNGGYQNPNECTQCKCINGFNGRRCENIPLQRKECGKTILFAEKKTNILELYGRMNCAIHIKTKFGQKIGIIVDYEYTENKKKYDCQPNNSLEIKYDYDKSITGPRFCHENHPIIFFSKSNYILIYYNNFLGNGGFRIRYRKFKQYIHSMSLQKK